MSVVKINAVIVPADKQARFEERFRGRAGAVEKTPGFEWFELLRPLEGTDQYLVYTRWSSEEAYRVAVRAGLRPRARGRRRHPRPRRGARRTTSGPTRCWSPPGRTRARRTSYERRLL